MKPGDASARSIALDAMGGDFAPDAALRAATTLSRRTDIRVLLAGDERVLAAGARRAGRRRGARRDPARAGRRRDGRAPGRRRAAHRHLARARDRCRRRRARAGARLGGQHRSAAALRGARHPAPARRAPHRLRGGLPDAAAAPQPGSVRAAPRRRREPALHARGSAPLRADGLRLCGAHLEGRPPERRSAQHRRGGLQGRRAAARARTR